MGFPSALVKNGIEEAIIALKHLPDPFSSKLMRSTEESVHRTFNCESISQLAPAHRVEQGGIGFSADEPIGTEHVGNCIGVIARDTVTGKTGLAHYDAVSTPESLQRLFDRLPDRKLDVVLVGAMYDENTTGKDYLRDTSASNLREVLGFLSGKNVNILGLRIHDPKQPTNFTVNPKDFSFHPISPDIPNPDKDLAFARKFLADPKQPLAIEFDLTHSKERFPYLLDREQVHNLNNHVRGKSHEDVAAWHNSLGAHGGFEKIQADLSLGTYLPAYERAVESVMQRLGRNDDAMESSVRSQPMHIGQNAASANDRPFESLDQKPPPSAQLRRGSDGKGPSAGPA